MLTKVDRVSAEALDATVARVRADAAAALDDALAEAGDSARRAGDARPQIDVLATSARARPPRGRDVLWRHLHESVDARWRGRNAAIPDRE